MKNSKIQTIQLDFNRLDQLIGRVAQIRENIINNSSIAECS